MRQWLVWILLIVLLAVFSQQVLNGNTNTLSSDDYASLVYKIGLLVLIGGAVLTLFRINFIKAIQNILIWCVIALALILGYTYRYELKDVRDRVMLELMPGSALTQGNTVELVRSRSGDFQISAHVNGTSVPMIFDTGASTVVLTHEAAQSAGIPVDFLKYNVNVETANGRAFAAAVTIDRLAVGGIVERSIPALIAQPGQLKISLLGMSFLNRLRSWEVRGSKLMMHAYPSYQ